MRGLVACVTSKVLPTLTYDAGRDWGQEEKGTTEDEMVGWHHRLNGHGFGLQCNPGTNYIPSLPLGLQILKGLCPRVTNTQNKVFLSVHQSYGEKHHFVAMTGISGRG